MTGEYQSLRRVQYSGGATFIPVCPACGRFVKPDDGVYTNLWDGNLVPGPNATCAHCGRVEMPFEGFIEEEG
jgi:hypothetical protein